MMNLFFSLFVGIPAGATPILEQGVGTGTPYAVTILQDDTDKNLYYFFPAYYGLSTMSDRRAFACLQTKFASGSSQVDCNMIFEASVKSDTLKKIQEVKALNPQARFSPIIYTSMKTLVDKKTSPYLTNVSCQALGGETGQQVTCNWRVVPSRFAPFRRLLMGNALVQVMQFSAEFVAVVDKAKIKVLYTIPMYVADLGKGDYFFDGEGHPLR